MTLKLLKQLVKRGGIKGIILNLLVMLAVRYLRKKLLGNDRRDPDNILNKLGESSDWRDIFGSISSDDRSRLLDEIMRRL